MTTKTAAQRGTAVSVKSLAITAICLVLVYVLTAVVNIRLPFAPNGGLIHLGNVPLFVAAILFGKRTGMIAGGIGMALFDLLSGWTLWAPFTLVIVGCMGFVVGAVTEKKKSFPFYLLVLLPAEAVIFAVEAVAYAFLLKGGHTRGRRVLYALAANAASFAAGFFSLQPVLSLLKQL